MLGLGVALYVGGIICMALAQVIAIIVGIYCWGGAGMELGPAAWEGAKIWIWMMIGGGICAAVGGGICAGTK